MRHQVVIFGDSGNGNGQRDVLNMAKDFGADFILHLGDFDYDGAAASRVARDGTAARDPGHLTAVPGRHTAFPRLGGAALVAPPSPNRAGERCAYNPADEPETFMPGIWEVLGDDYPYFAAIGNNDEAAWSGSGCVGARGGKEMPPVLRRR